MSGIETAPEEPDTDLTGALTSFLDSARGISATAPFAMVSLLQGAVEQTVKLSGILKDLRGKTHDELNNSQAVARITEARSLGRTSRANTELLKRFMSYFLVGLVTELDILLSNLYRACLVRHPEIYERSDKKADYSEVFSVGIEQFRAIALEREVDAFGRKSHIDQIGELQRVTKMELQDYLKDLPSLIELTERRNLFVHTGGRVTEQYISNCSKAGCKTDPKPSVGENLSIELGYLLEASRTVLVAGLVLAHLVWRKLHGLQASSDKALNDFGYAVLCAGQTGLAIDVFEFGANGLKKHHSDSSHRTMIVNLANSHRLNGNLPQALRILADKDWSSTSLDFKLAIAAIRGQNKEALKLMKEIGPDNKAVNKLAYHEWPVFNELRNNPEFREVYKEIFNEDFVDQLQMRKELDQIADEAKQLAGGLEELSKKAKPATPIAISP